MPSLSGPWFDEHGYLGAPIAKFAMETYVAKKEGRPLPTLDAPATPPVRITAATPTGTGGTGTQRNQR